MTSDEMTSVLEAGCEDRYDYFLSAVAENRDIWILVNGNQQFLKIYDEDDGIEYLPVWPDRTFAAAYGDDASGLEPKSISLPEFFKKWIDGLTRDGLQVGVFPGSDATVWMLTPSELKNDLQEAMSAP
ncbi:DUF2750 domain-containing protein [Allohahella sp. A8]|uniref:DUF2750 domain-containing protein n=1 Tax=Allohahella sp. A8 TaxID=3141461 RepID=UPI000C09CA2D|nr:hypothetical protein [Hahellaceae bacterium]